MMLGTKLCFPSHPIGVFQLNQRSCLKLETESACCEILFYNQEFDKAHNEKYLNTEIVRSTATISQHFRSYPELASIKSSVPVNDQLSLVTRPFYHIEHSET